MARVSSDDIVRVARELFRRHGFAGASMQDLADGVGLRKASLYSRIPDKEKLIAAVLDLTLAEIFPPDAADHGVAGFAAALARLADSLRDYRRCVGLHLAYGVSAQDGAVHPAVAAFFATCRDRLAGMLSSDMPQPLAEELAMDTLASLEGGSLWLVLAGDARPLDRAVAALVARAGAAAASEPPQAERDVLAALVGDWRRASAAERKLAARLVQCEERATHAEEVVRGQAEAAACFL